MAVYPNRSHIIAERLVILNKYIKEHASPVHAVKASEMLAYLAEKGYNIAIKTLYSDLSTLETCLGLKIQYDGRQKGYILIEPEFEPYELRMIVSSIQAAKFITQQEADRLTSKIIGIADEYTRPSLNRKTFVHNRVRAINQDAMQGLDTIYEDIAQDKKISYKHFFYTSDSHNPKYYSNYAGNEIITASPYEVHWNGEVFIISATQSKEGKEEFTTLLLDHMEQIEILAETREGKELIEKQTKARLNSKRRRLRPSQIKLKVSRIFATFVIDKFGTDVVMMIPQNGEDFTAIVNTCPTPELYMWTLKFHPRIEIIFPEDAESRLRKYFAEIAEGKQPYPPFGRESKLWF